METDFWRDRWTLGEIGFHRLDENPNLRAYWAELGLSPDTAVLVPLCGKSLDMHALADWGHPVLGVEVVELAVQSFFAEAGLEPTRTREDPFERYSAGPIEILRGDFFDLDRARVSRVGGLYDRAALIALPPAMRVRYAAHMASLLRRGTRGLMVSIEFVEGHRPGPPHEVTEDEVRSLFEPAFEVEVLRRGEPESTPPRFAEAGLRRVRDVVYRLERR